MFFGCAIIAFRAVNFVGTPEFMAPELVADHSICYASDLWALGVLLYELVSFTYHSSLSLIILREPIINVSSN